MWSSNGGAASWPAYTFPGTNLTLRANTDAGIAFLVGTLYSSTAGAWTLTTSLPAAFRPLANLSVVDLDSVVSLGFAPTGTVTLGASAAASRSYYWRSFYFTTVAPG